jgi:hypothetical protein
LGGIKKNLLIDNINEGLQANHISDYQGEAKLTDIPNYSERRKTTEMALNLLGAFPKNNEQDNPKIELKLRLKELNTEQLKELLSGQNRGE